MFILIKIENKVVKIVLKGKSKVVDELSFPEENNLSEKLLLAIDKLLKRNKINPLDIKNIRFKSDIKESFTTNRIAAAVAKAYNFAVDKL